MASELFGKLSFIWWEGAVVTVIIDETLSKPRFLSRYAASPNQKSAYRREFNVYNATPKRYQLRSEIFEIKSFVKELCCDGVFKAREITKEILLLCGKETTFLTLQSRRYSVGCYAVLKYMKGISHF